MKPARVSIWDSTQQWISPSLPESSLACRALGFPTSGLEKLRWWPHLLLLCAMKIHLLQLSSLSIFISAHTLFYLEILCSFQLSVGEWGKRNSFALPWFSFLSMSSTFQKRFIICYYVFHVCVCLWMCACECRCWRNSEEGTDSPRAGQAANMVLGMELRSPVSRRYS